MTVSSNLYRIFLPGLAGHFAPPFTVSARIRHLDDYRIVWSQFFGACFAQEHGLPGNRLISPLSLVSLHLGLTMDRARVGKISKALADATRLRILEAISANKHMNCGEIVSMRGVTPATVSHHLRILSEAGLIACRRNGQFVHSHAVPKTIKAYTQALMKIGRGKKTTRR
jgi:ArsR family transcriptional regulator